MKKTKVVVEIVLICATSTFECFLPLLIGFVASNSRVVVHVVLAVYSQISIIQPSVY